MIRNFGVTKRQAEKFAEFLEEKGIKHEVKDEYCDCWDPTGLKVVTVESNKWDEIDTVWDFWKYQL